MPAGKRVKSLTSQGNKRRSRSFSLFNHQFELESRLLLAADHQITGSVAGELLVQYRPEANVQSRALNRWNSGALLSQEIANSPGGTATPGMMELVQVPAGTSVEALASYFKNQPGVEFAEPNYMISVSEISNDPAYTDGTLWNMYGSDVDPAGPAGTTNIFGSNAESAWNAGNTGSRSVVVGIVDTGIQVTHPDLVSNIWINPNDIQDGIDNDGNGYVDDTNGWDFVNNDRSVYDGIADTHGTHVAGIIGARGGNRIGVAGVNWNVSMISAKFIGSQGGTTVDAVRAIDYLTDLKIRNGVNIVAVNASWGASAYSAAIHSAINRAAKADILFVAAAGNNRNNTDQVPFYPASNSSLNASATESAASYDSVISVSALTNSGTLANFSNYGKNSVDLVAPGSIITSTIPNGYSANSGTSMAAPHVAGAIALYAARYPGTSASTIRNAILSSTSTTSDLIDKIATGGRLDVNSALAVVPPPAATSSAISITDATIVEGASGITYAEISVALNQVNAAQVTVDYATANGTAIAGSDYTSVSGRLTFTPGVRSQIIRIPIVGNTIVEADESFFIRLSNPSSNATINRNQGVINILNDDNPTVPSTISGNNITVIEGNSETRIAIFNLIRTGNIGSTSVISFVTASRTAQANQDFVPASGTLIFKPGEVTKEVRVGIIGDTVVENDEFFGILLSSIVNARITTRDVNCTITDNDTTVVASMVIPGSAFTPVAESARPQAHKIIRKSGPEQHTAHSLVSYQSKRPKGVLSAIESFKPGSSTNHQKATRPRIFR